MPEEFLTFKVEPVPETSSFVFAINVAPLPSVSVLAVEIKAEVAVNQC